MVNFSGCSLQYEHTPLSILLIFARKELVTKISLFNLFLFNFMPFLVLRKYNFHSVTLMSLIVLWHIFIYIHKSIIEQSTTLFGLHQLFNINISCHIIFVFKDKNTVVINLSDP